VAAFAELDWKRIDVRAIVAFSGLASIDERRHQACRDWLARQGYAFDTFDCRTGLSVAIPELGRLLRWEEQFGYALDSDRCNLDAVEDGFLFDIPEGGGRVFEIVRADLGWQEDAKWLLGLVSIAQQESRRQLALGRRFFVLLVVPEESPLVGAVIEQTRVPGPFWSPCQEINEFAR
jgi:hypothetical protein